MFEEKENGELIGSDSGGSVGSDSGSASGSAGSGSDRRINGSGGNTDGNDTGTIATAGSAGSGERSYRSDSAIGNETNASADFGQLDGNQNDVDRRSRAERIRQRQPIRLGSVRNRDTATAGADSGRTAGAESGDSSIGGESIFGQLDEEPVIRLGARRQAKPKENVKAVESGASAKLSDSKDVITLFVNSIFEVPAAMLRQDFWKLSKEESKTLVDAIIQWLESMPKSRQSRIALFINENLPLINLAMVGFFIVSERVKTSMEVAKIQRNSRAFTIGADVAAKAEQAARQNDTIRTPMDSIFSS